MNCIIKKLLSQPSDRSPITLRCTGASLPPLLLKVRYNGIMDNLWWFVTLTSTQLSSIPPVTNGYDFVHNTQHKQETMHWVRYKDTESGCPPPIPSLNLQTLLIVFVLISYSNVFVLQSYGITYPLLLDQ